MTWFVAAAIIGFGLFHLWRKNYQIPGPAGYSIPLIVLLGFLIVVAPIAWAISSADYWNLPIIIDRLGSAEITRFLLGLVLGIGAAFILHQRESDLAAARIGNSYATPWGVADWSAALSAAVTITLLAVFSPNIDNWLARISSFKAAIIEFQVRGETIHKVSVADNLETSSSYSVLNILKDYHDVAITLDRDYLEQVEKKIPSLTKDARTNLDDRINQTNALLFIFRDLIAPIAECIDKLIDNGLGIEHIRQSVRPSAERLHKVALSLHDDPQLRETFWKNLIDLPESANQFIITIPNRTDSFSDLDTLTRCADVKKYGGNPGDKKRYPSIHDHMEVPYLYVASALLMHFVQDDDIALELLNKYRSREKAHPDHLFWKLISKFAYYSTQSTDKVIEPLEKWHAVIQNHLTDIDKYCTDSDIRRRLKQRELSQELVLMNNYTYFVAEDLARGIKVASQYAATAQDYAHRLKTAVDRTDPAVGPSRDDFLDTYAYATIVLETRKQSPNLKKIRDMANLLELLVERFEAKSRDSRSRMTQQFDLAALKAVRVHYAAARDLAGE